MESFAAGTPCFKFTALSGHTTQATLEQLQSSLFYSFLEVIWLTGSKKMKKFNITEQSINYPLPSVTLSGAAPNRAEANQSCEVGLEAAA